MLSVHDTAFIVGKLVPSACRGDSIHFTLGQLTVLKFKFDVERIKIIDLTP